MIKLLKLAAVILLLGSLQNVVAQDTESPKNSLKFHLFTDRGKSITENANITSEARSFWVLPGFSYSRIRPSGNTHELSIEQFNISRNFLQTVVTDPVSGLETTVQGAIVKNATFRLGYAYQFALNKPENKLQFLLGAQANHYFYARSVDPLVANSFPSSNHNMGLSFDFEPRLQYRIGKHLVVDAVISAEILDLEYNRNKTKNPFLPADQQVIKSTDVDTFGSFISGRIGIGVLF